MNRGDQLLLYAVGDKKIFAACRLEEDPRRDVSDTDPLAYEQWPHAAAIQLGPHIDNVELGPSLTDINPSYGEMHEGVSEYVISAADYQTGVRLILEAEELERQARRRSPGI